MDIESCKSNQEKIVTTKVDLLEDIKEKTVKKY